MLSFIEDFYRAAAHNVIKYSKRMRNKYLSLVRRIGKNGAILAIARILLEKYS